MARTILSSLFFIGALGAQAHLDPTVDAPLYQHMLEVNKEWCTMDPALAADTRPVHFTRESERIAAHLFHVRAFLLGHAPAGLGTEAAAERAALLDELGAYAGRGIFPINDVAPRRNPVFIDRIGTACAVGHLIITSGHGDISQAIHDATNLAYVRELTGREDLLAWAATHGFTPAELAWIQPGYESQIPWNALGGGTNDRVTCLAHLGDDLIAAGDFTTAGGTGAMHVTAYDGTAFSALGAGLGGTPVCALQNGTDLYIGGSGFNGGFNDLAHWNGTQWTYSNVFSGNMPRMSALCLHDGELYAAGATMGFAGTDHHVMRLHNGSWEHVGDYLNGAVTSLASFNGSLIAGGAFTGLDGPTDPLIAHVAVLTGSSWLQLGDGLDAPVNTLLTVDGSLYAGGDLYVNIVPAFGLARIAAGASAWEALLPGHDVYMQGAGPTSIRALAAGDDGIYFGGDFILYAGMSFGSNIGLFLGEPDAVQNMGTLDGGVDALTILGQQLVAGGAFAGRSYLASTDLITGIESPAAPIIGLLPNPAEGPVTVTLDRDASPNAVLDVLDASGRRVMAPLALRARSTPLDVSALAQGPYLLRLRMDGITTTHRFIKH